MQGCTVRYGQPCRAGDVVRKECERVTKLDWKERKKIGIQVGCLKKMSKMKKLHWRVHTKGLLEELQSIIPTSYIVRDSLKIFDSLLRLVAKRAIELNDPELNRLMIRLTLYSIADPESPDYKPRTVAKILSAKKDLRK